MSFDVESLFTNVPLQKSINVILNRIYGDKLINTDIKKNTMCKLIKDTCKKTAFSLENIIYDNNNLFFKYGIAPCSSLS